MKKTMPKQKAPWGVAVVAMLAMLITVSVVKLAGAQLPKLSFRQEVVRQTSQLLAGQLSGEPDTQEPTIGAFITSGTGFTDVAITNDLTIDQSLRVSGTTTLGTNGGSGRLIISVENGSSTAATSTGYLARHQNTGLDMICGPVLAYFDVDQSKAPGAFQVSVATSTGGLWGNPEEFIIATTTIATNTDAVVATTSTFPFIGTGTANSGVGAVSGGGNANIPGWWTFKNGEYLQVNWSSRFVSPTASATDYATMKTHLLSECYSVRL